MILLTVSAETDANVLRSGQSKQMYTQILSYNISLVYVMDAVNVMGILYKYPIKRNPHCY